MFALNVLNNFGHRGGFYGLKLRHRNADRDGDLKIHIARPLAKFVGGDQSWLIRSACSRNYSGDPGIA